MVLLFALKSLLNIFRRRRHIKLFAFALSPMAQPFGGRQIPHILLIHANELTADSFEALIKIFKDKGYRFITVEDALQDAAYRFPDKYAPTSDWLSHWTFSEGKRFEVPQPPEYIQQIFQGKQ